jgi:hypothetical protein
MWHGFVARSLGAWLALAPTMPPPAGGQPPAGRSASPGGSGAPASGPGAAAAGPPSGAGPSPTTAVIPFRTDAQPRVDPVFGDAGALRASVDRFLGLQTDMERVRDDFSNAVHETLSALASNAGVPGPTGKVAPAAPGCPAATAAPYARALAAGTRYLLLGQQLQGRYRDIRRADDLGDAAALTPDYRVKIKKARELHQRLLDDYREMRVAFYDQLGAEMRHAGCKTGAKAAAALADGAAAPAPSPSDPGAWTMDEPVADEPAPPPTPAGPTAAPAPRGDAEKTPPAGATMAAPAIWIDVDNTLCAQPTRVSVDGQSLGEVAPRKKTSVRTHAGPREICALPESDPRSCGDTGTIRKAYLHEGWSLTVHCEK